MKPLELSNSEEGGTLFLDGDCYQEIIVEVDGNTVCLNPDQARQAAKYLETWAEGK